VLGAAAGIVFLAVLLRVPEPLPPGPGPGEIRVVTYNIRAGLGGLDAIAEDVRKLSPDVVALQEVERGVRRSREIDQARALAEALGMEHAFGGSFRVERGEHGVAILSRFPMADVEIVRLPQGNGRWPRVALKARIDAPGAPFRMVCVHLTRPWGWPTSHTRARLAQIRAMRESLAGDSLAAVVAGDFNSFPISLEGLAMSRWLRNAWKPWRDGWATTFPLETVGWPGGGIHIDHVFHDASWESRGNWIARRGASDHRAVVADLAAAARP
jgi:endonuclease/exonuclease/phosphatase family metal-dependent hydrolase